MLVVFLVGLLSGFIICSLLCFAVLYISKEDK